MKPTATIEYLAAHTLEHATLPDGHKTAQRKTFFPGDPISPEIFDQAEFESLLLRGAIASRADFERRQDLRKGAV